MAAEPIPMPLDGSNKVSIDQNGNITGDVEVNNGGVVKFEVSQYPAGMQVCMINISSANVTWAASDTAGGNTIKVGQGG